LNQREAVIIWPVKEIIGRGRDSQNGEIMQISGKEYGPVVLCTGGFAADFGPSSVLAKHRPDLLHLPTVSVESGPFFSMKAVLHRGWKPGGEVG